MSDLLDRAERLWTGDVEPDESDLSPTEVELAEVAPGVAFVSSIGNVGAFATPDGLVLIDAGSRSRAERVVAAVRAWSEAPVDTIVYTHGHIDHVMGAAAFDRDAEARGHRRVRVVGHRNVLERFDRYRLMAGYHTVVGRRQYRRPDFEWPRDYRAPDETYEDACTLDIGGKRFELRHAMGETDDHTWVFVPQDGVVCTGDLFTWSCPPAGAPHESQRYATDWALALREMAQLDAEILVPGHGPPITGADRIRQALEETAELLESLVEQAIALMNQGVPIDRVVKEVRAPDRLLGRPYLRPTYDDPEFVVRNVWRENGGWFGGNPTELKPAGDADVAREVARLAGGPAALADRARELADSGDLRLAGHLAQLAMDAAPDDTHVRAVYVQVFDRRSGREPSLLARNIFGAAADAGRRADD